MPKTTEPFQGGVAHKASGCKTVGMVGVTVGRLSLQSEASTIRRMSDGQIQLALGDISRLEVDAIVNAANRTLLGGGGVDGAIHRAAGSELLAACRLLNGCETGFAKITRGYRLKAKWVIHTVGPVWRSGKSNEPELLKSCYRESLLLAEKNGVGSIAFPSISTGAYRFPIDLASEIAVSEVRQYLTNNSSLYVTFVCFSDADYKVYENLLSVPH
jgi:O-acetyl-ADP-ribose deacetylase